MSPWSSELGSEREGAKPFQQSRKGRTAMDTNSQTLFFVRQAEHHIRLRESQRIRDAEQAAASQPARPRTLPIRAWMSAALIAAGERMQQKITMEPMQADVIR